MQIFATIAGYIRPHVDDIALALVATLLVIFGDTINGFVRKLVRKQLFVVRIAALIALCAFGYGAITVWVSPMLESVLRQLDSVELVVAVFGSFLAIGILAERYHKAG